MVPKFRFAVSILVCDIFAVGPVVAQNHPPGGNAARDQRLNAAMVKALATADVRERYVASGMQAVISTPQDYADHLREETVKLRKMAAAAKIPL